MIQQRAMVGEVGKCAAGCGLDAGEGLTGVARAGITGHVGGETGLKAHAVEDVVIAGRQERLQIDGEVEAGGRPGPPLG